MTHEMNDGDDNNELREAFVGALSSTVVQRACAAIWAAGSSPSLSELLELSRSLCEALGRRDKERTLRAELNGYEGVGLEVPERRRVTGYASPFPVRAIGLLDPEEIFLANREKFAQVTLTIGQPIRDLENALLQIKEGGVLSLRVPASEVTGEAAATEDESEVFIYILPREIERVVDGVRRITLDTLVGTIVEAAVGSPRPEEEIEESSLSRTDPFIELADAESLEDATDAVEGA